jgi:His/Glu/Gln/Arg/opine family amino acid ABC transporter permease subunit
MRILDIPFMIKSLPEILRGVPVGMAITLVGMLLGCIIGLLTALLRIYKIPVASQISTVYISFMRGTPLMVQILIAYYGIPVIIRWINFYWGTSINISSIPALYYMFYCYSLCVGAYLSEMFRSAILSVDLGQMEACYSIGMTVPQSLIRIILPQALTNAIPNLGNTFISLVKDTSLAFTASVAEVMGMAKIVAGRTSKFFEAYIVAALIYWAMCIVFEQIVRKLEKFSRRFERGHAANNQKNTALTPQAAK